MIHVSARLVARPDRIEQLAQVFRELVPPSRAEPGCVRYEVYQGEKDPAVFITFEQWRDQAAVDAHMTSAHVGRAFAAAAAMLGAEPEIRNYSRLV